MRLERLNNSPNFVNAIFLFFGTTASFIERTSSSETEAKQESIFFFRLLVGEYYLANHLRASQSVCSKITIHLRGIYTVY